MSITAHPYLRYKVQDFVVVSPTITTEAPDKTIRRAADASYLSINRYHFYMW